MQYITVSAAYGRQYKNRAAARAAWDAGDDFIIRTIGVPGMYISKRDVTTETINIRYDEDRRVCTA